MQSALVADIKMFYLIGLGLGAPTDIPPNSLQTIKLCERVYLEAYTSILLHGGKEVLVSHHKYCFLEL